MRNCSRMNASGRSPSVCMPLIIAVVGAHDLLGILLAQRNGLVRIALEGHPREFDHIRITEHFARDLEDERRFVERRTLLGERQRERVAAEIENIHNVGIFSQGKNFSYLWQNIAVWSAFGPLRQAICTKFPISC